MKASAIRVVTIILWCLILKSQLVNAELEKQHLFNFWLSFFELIDPANKGNDSNAKSAGRWASHGYGNFIALNKNIIFQALERRTTDMINATKEDVEVKNSLIKATESKLHCLIDSI